MKNANNAVGIVRRWTPAVVVLAITLLGTGAAQARAKGVSAAKQQRVDAAITQFEHDQAQRDNDLTGDRDDIQMARMKLANDLAALREQLLVDRQQAALAELAMQDPTQVDDLSVLDVDWHQVLAEDQRALDQARRDNNCLCRQAVARMASDELRWRAILNADQRELTAARRAAGR